MKRLRIGLVGAGHLGRIHARLLRELDHVELAAVADPVAESRRLVGSETRAIELADYRDLIGHIDAAIIATPTRSHYAVAMDLLRHGIHLLIEKPLAATAEEAEELVWAAHWHGAVLQVGHIERFNPALREILPGLQRPRMIEAIRQSNYSFRSTDIGVVLDLMIHDLDLVLWLTGARVRSVSATGWSVLGGHEDVAQARLELTGGCVANLSASRVSHRPCRQMQIWTARGQTEIDFATRRVAVVEPADRRIDVPHHQQPSPTNRFEQLLPLQAWEAPARNALVDEQRDFVDSIRTGRTPRVSGEDGLRVVAAAEMILAKLAEYRWEHGAAEASIPPTEPDILRGPHWSRWSARSPFHRKEAG